MTGICLGVLGICLGLLGICLGFLGICLGVFKNGVFPTTPFWTKQPVMPTHKTGIICVNPLQTTDYFTDVFRPIRPSYALRTSTLNVNDPLTGAAFDLIRHHFHPQYHPPMCALTDMFTETSYITTIQHKSAVIGVITSRAVHCVVHKRELNDVYYDDLLCVQPDYRGKQLAATLIQTHYLNQCALHPSSLIHVFKREETLLANVVPLIQYAVHGYSVASILADHFIEWLEPLSAKEATRVLQSVSNEDRWAIQLTATGNHCTQVYYVGGAVYVLQTTYMQVDKDSLAFCSGSYRPDTMSVSQFVHGFRRALKSFSQHQRTGYVGIELLSDNVELVQSLLTPLRVSQSAYYLYNYAFSADTILPQHVWAVGI